MTGRRLRVCCVQQGAWDAGKESMPLAIGYLKAMVMADAGLKDEVDIRIVNLSGGTPIARIVQQLLADDVPDIIAFSVLGWNFRAFGAAAETFRQVNPTGLVVFGGTHVANQAERVFRIFPQVDLVANGEGETTFLNVLRRYLGTSDRHDFAGVNGLSFKTRDGETITNPDQDRISDLESIPSPFLTGAIPLTDDAGNFRYDVALMETNRGCPYSCAFCYWGGATGQKVRRFSRDRLREELHLFGKLGVPNIVLCDANFAIHKDDMHFIEDFVRTREKYWFPRTLDTSWAKNKSKVFYDIVRRMKAEGLKSSFTLALQTMTEPALQLMNRRNMKINEWEDLVSWLAEEGMDCYAELIWGAPGDSYDEFLKGYDKLAQNTSRIAVYPLQILPNTEYARERDKLGLITARGDDDDFEYVLGHRGSTLLDNRRMQKFLMWARPIGEHMFFRHIWGPLRALTGLTQSQVLLSMASWFERRPERSLEFMRTDGDTIIKAEVVSRVVRQLYRTPALHQAFRCWWDAEIVPRLPAGAAPLLTEIFEFDQLSRPIFDEVGVDAVELEVVRVDGLDYYVRECRERLDALQIARDMMDGVWREARYNRQHLRLFYRCGFHQYVDSHEVAVHYFGQTEIQLQMGRVEEERPLAIS